MVVEGIRDEILSIVIYLELGDQSNGEVCKIVNPILI